MNSVIILDRDLARLRPLAAGELQDELDRADVVTVDELPRSVVTMHSRVRYLDETSGERRRVTLVYPDQTDLRRGRISVLAPVGAALLGLRAGDTIDWEFPQGHRRLRIERVIQCSARRGGPAEVQTLATQ